MKLPTADQVLRNAQLAKADPLGAVTQATTADPVRLKKAGEGLLRKGAAEVARYFDRNVANPFPDGGWTSAIQLANVPGLFGVTALGKELRAASGDEARLAALTAPLDKLLLDKGFSAKFTIGSREETDGASLHVRLKVWLHEG